MSADRRSPAGPDRSKAASGVEIRPVGLDERAAWEPLWQGYQAFYKVTIPAATTAVTWARLHDPNEPMGVLGAYVDGELCGIVHYLFHRSCWTTGDYCYLQDLFVAAGASRVYWLTHESNTQARALYDTLAERSGFIQYRKLF